MPITPRKGSKLHAAQQLNGLGNGPTSVLDAGLADALARHGVELVALVLAGRSRGPSVKRLRTCIAYKSVQPTVLGRD